MSKIQLMPLAVDDFWEMHGLAQKRNTDTSESRPYVLLSVARLEAGARDKGIDDVIRALPQVRDRLSRPLRYVVVGDGDDLPYLRELATSIGVRDMIEFRQRVRDEELAEIYGFADQFVLPSRREGFGLVFAEAMAFGLPVVAVAARGATDVVVDGRNGVLIEQVDELCGAILRVAEDREYALSLGLQGQGMVRSQYSFAAFAERTDTMLASLPR